MNADALAQLLGCSPRKARRFLPNWYGMQPAEGVPAPGAPLVTKAATKRRGRRPYVADAESVRRWRMGEMRQAA